MISFETQYTLGVMMNVYHSSHFTDEETESLRVQMAVSCYPVTHSTARQELLVHHVKSGVPQNSS